MTEPTLGARILWAAQNWEAVRSEDGVMAGRDEYETLRALCARADAAERLAAAVDVLDRDDWREVDADGVPLVANEHDNALAAWRVTTEEVQS